MMFFCGNYLYNGFYVDCFLENYYRYEKGILRFVSMLFKIFEKLSQVFKHFKKGYEQKIVLGFLRFCKYAFFKIFEKEDKQ